MLLSSALKIGVLTAGLGLLAHGQDPPSEARGLPPRAAPADYQARAQAGPVTIAAEFKGHAVPTLDGTLTTEDYVVVEVALFGPAEARTKLSSGDFSLRINGRRSLPGQPYALVFSSLKDPEWVPPEPPASKSKTSLGGGGESNQPPEPVKIPLELQRSMAQRVQKSALPEGDRPLPQAGLLFFQYRGKAEGIQAVQLLYSGSAGKAVLPLQP